MNNATRKSTAFSERSRLSRKLIVRYFEAIAFIAGGIVLFTGMSAFICGLIRWNYTSVIYALVSFASQNIIALMIAVFILCWVIMTCLFFRKPLKYLDSMTGAAAQLAEHPDQPIILPEELSESERELNRVREKAVNDAKAAAAAEQRKSDLIMYLAHDLKTPLSSVIGYLNLLQDEDKLPEELKAKYLGIALSKAERLEDLINEFFEITRFNLSSVTLEYKRVDLVRMLQQLSSEFSPQLKEKGLECKIYSPGSIAINCDPDKLERVFDNLLRNAVIYSFPDTAVEIAASVEGRNAVICFKNQGNTIPKEKLNRIFDQFFRADAARGTKGGAGLGLAIAKQITELHGGTITAESHDETVMFTVIIPLKI